jgi:hypothetical protein
MSWERKGERVPHQGWILNLVLGMRVGLEWMQRSMKRAVKNEED